MILRLTTITLLCATSLIAAALPCHADPNDHPTLKKTVQEAVARTTDYNSRNNTALQNGNSSVGQQTYRGDARNQNYTSTNRTDTHPQSSTKRGTAARAE